MIVIWLVLLCVPWLTGSEYWLDTGIAIATFAVLSTGLNLIYGYAGLLSFAQVAFFGLGGYGAALLVTRLGCSFWLPCRQPPSWQRSPGC